MLRPPQAACRRTAVYMRHSSDILEVIGDLKEKAEEDLAAPRKVETNAKQNYEMPKQSHEDAGIVAHVNRRKKTAVRRHAA